MLIRQERTNIYVAYILSFLGNIYFPAAAWLFFYLRFMTYTEVALLAAIGGIASIIFEIPTGAFADIVGRRTALILSYFIYTAAMVTEAFANSFWMFALIAVLVSLVNALYSGSLEALVYDTLLEDGHEDRYDQVVSKMESLAWVGLLVGALFGGFMYASWFRMPFIAQGVVALIAALASFALIEPRIDTIKYDLSQMLTQNIQGFKEVFRDIHVAHHSLFFIIIESGFYLSSSLLGISQAIEYGLDARGISVLFSIGYLVSAVVSYQFPRIRAFLGTRQTLLLSTVLLLSSFIFAQYVGMIVGSMLIIARIASSTVASNMRSVVMNRFYTSKNRTTSISTMMLLSYLPFTFGAYFIGIYIEKHSPNTFAFVLGWIMIVLLVLHQASRYLFRNPQLQHIGEK